MNCSIRRAMCSQGDSRGHGNRCSSLICDRFATLWPVKMRDGPAPSSVWPAVVPMFCARAPREAEMLPGRLDGHCVMAFPIRPVEATRQGVVDVLQPSNCSAVLGG